MTEILFSLSTAKKTVRQGLGQTVTVARAELFKATQKALIGKNMSVAVSILGGASTLVTSYVARTKGTNELRASKSRARALDRFYKGYSGTTLEASQSMRTWATKVGSGCGSNVGVGRTQRNGNVHLQYTEENMSGCGYIIIVEDSDTTVLVPATHSPVTYHKIMGAYANVLARG
ncbi:hypothetical protein BGY98DRAFT_935998 [Russula aff. rugulosa BPL654]|nr:hypothetical protein BGY98DRAFT_935998 [Russula aff. rugulosa BPL654]